MKKLVYNLTLLGIIVCSLKASAQQKKDTSYIPNKDLVGVWQQNSNTVGNGLDQNFEFYNDGRFVLNLGNDGEDLRNIIN